jgi:hypothetical protein
MPGVFSEKCSMAKRTTPRSQSNDAAAPAAAPTPPKARRSRAATSRRSDAAGASPRVENAEGLESKSTSMDSGPSEEDIRRRAYQRYVERGGSNGTDFEDWLQAERELKKSNGF